MSQKSSAKRMEDRAKRRGFLVGEEESARILAVQAKLGETPLYQLLGTNTEEPVILWQPTEDEPTIDLDATTEVPQKPTRRER